MSTKKYKKQKAIKPHAFVRKICHWFYCSYCGLVLLNNEPTILRASRPCEALDD